MIYEYNVIFKYEGKSIIRKYYTKSLDNLYKYINHDKELLTNDGCISVIYDKKYKYVGEF